MTRSECQARFLGEKSYKLWFGGLFYHRREGVSPPAIPKKCLISLEFTDMREAKRLPYGRRLLFDKSQYNPPQTSKPRHPQRDSAVLFSSFNYLIVPLLSFWMTSCAPPSTMEVAETRVSTAFSCSSGMVRAPQLHMVDLTLARVMATLSFRLPA